SGGATIKILCISMTARSSYQGMRIRAIVAAVKNAWRFARRSVIYGIEQRIGLLSAVRTFATEYQEGAYWLVTLDQRGVSHRLAKFENREGVAVFNETLALAKAAAHAAGRSGI